MGCARPQSFRWSCSPDALIWGDSLAAHLYCGLSTQASRANLTTGQATLSLCAPILNLSAYYTAGCEEFNDHIFSLIRQDPPKAVILAGRWEVVGLDDIAAPAHAMHIKALHNDTVGSPVAENDYGRLNQRVAEVAEQSGAALISRAQVKL